MTNRFAPMQNNHQIGTHRPSLPPSSMMTAPFTELAAVGGVPSSTMEPQHHSQRKSSLKATPLLPGYNTGFKFMPPVGFDDEMDSVPM